MSRHTISARWRRLTPILAKVMPKVASRPAWSNWPQVDQQQPSHGILVAISISNNNYFPLVLCFPASLVSGGNAATITPLCLPIYWALPPWRSYMMLRPCRRTISQKTQIPLTSHRRRSPHLRPHRGGRPVDSRMRMILYMFIHMHYVMCIGEKKYIKMLQK